MAKSDNKEKSSELITQGRKAFQRCNDAEKDNRQVALDDIKFSRLSEQWPANIIKQRELEKRPCLTVNKMKPFIRQVVNDSRQNKPQIKVHPVDDTGDIETAKVINGLIRNIEYTSNADVAYDTAIESSVSGGFGYWRIGLDYAYDDTFDMDLSIDRVANQFSVYGDPDGKEADSSDWNVAFVVERMGMSAFKDKYGGKKNIDGKLITTDVKDVPQDLAEKPVDFDTDSTGSLNASWFNDSGVMIAEWWTRTVEEEEIVKLSNGHVYCADELFEDPAEDAKKDEKYTNEGTDEQMQAIRLGLQACMLKIVNKRMRKVHKVKQVIMTGVDVLEVNEWPGKYIPIVPVYGDEIVVQGKRYFRGLIHDAKDAQRMFNYWKTASTELVALAPRVPFIGRKGAFDSDGTRWSTANTASHPFLEYDGPEAPQRQPLDGGSAAGAMNEALSASDDMKAIIGLYDASLGARSNETSGKAIMARQREGDVSTFHFIDNLSRAIRHTGRILIDLIPKVYTGERIIRVIGEDGSQKAVQVNTQQAVPVTDPSGNPEVDEQGNAITAIHDITTGKYDLTVTTGPSYTTMRQEAAESMTEMGRAFPPLLQAAGDIMIKNMDWPGAQEIADRLKKMNPVLQQQNIPPELQQQLQQMQQAIQQLQGENVTLKQDKSIDAYNAETNRLKTVGPMALQQNPFNGPFPIPGGPQPNNGNQAGPPMPPMMPPG
jgi:hypothetical protein